MNVAEIIPDFKSDHSSILIQFKITPDVKRAPGLWKFPSYLLQDETYTPQFLYLVDFFAKEIMKILILTHYGKLSNIKFVDILLNLQ